MDESERLSTVVALRHVYEQHSIACELLISAFAAAARSARRATVCKPFPTHIFGAEGFDAAAAAVGQLPALVDLYDHDGQGILDNQIQLLQWLLLQLQRTWAVSHCTPSQFCADLQDQQQTYLHCSQALKHAVQQSCWVFRVAAACSEHRHNQQPRPKSIPAFHGTDFAAMHSILQQGLLAASGTRLQTTGAVFGQGIYLSTDFSTAFSFTKGREAWANSTLGHHLRCVLLCEVAEQAAVCQDAQRGGTASSSLPNTYIVAPRPSDVVIKYLLVFSDDSMLGRAPRRLSTSSSAAGSRSSMAGNPRCRPASATSACWALTCAYLGFMLLFALWRSSHSKW